MFAVRTEVFDGPLDLLLHLVRKDGVDLLQISMARVADAYLAWLDRMRELNLSVAADYLAMAATLVYLKSRELLPRPPTATVAEEEEEDPRQKLIRQLVEHQRYREGAESLDQRPQLGRDVFARPPEAGENEVARRSVAPIDAFGLLDAYYDLLRKAAAPEPVHAIGDSGPDIGATCRFVLGHFASVGSEGRPVGGKGGTADLGAILMALPRRVERILAFLAVLEMARLGWIAISQPEHLGPVELLARVDADVDLEPIVGRIDADRERAERATA